MRKIISFMHITSPSPDVSNSMRVYSSIRTISIIAYLLIILRGEMIAFPFFMFLIFSLLEWGTITEFAAIAALVGLFWILISPPGLTRKSILNQIIIFILLLLPIFERLITIPISLFNYPAFLIPLICFIVLYLISVVILYKGVNRQNSLRIK